MFFVTGSRPLSLHPILNSAKFPHDGEHALNRWLLACDSKGYSYKILKRLWKRDDKFFFSDFYLLWKDTLVVISNYRRGCWRVGIILRGEVYVTETTTKANALKLARAFIGGQLLDGYLEIPGLPLR